MKFYHSLKFVPYFGFGTIIIPNFHSSITQHKNTAPFIILGKKNFTISPIFPNFANQWQILWKIQMVLKRQVQMCAHRMPEACQNVNGTSQSSSNSPKNAVANVFKNWATKPTLPASKKPEFMRIAIVVPFHASLFRA